jgi:hypothetical protein
VAPHIGLLDSLSPNNNSSEVLFVFVGKLLSESLGLCTHDVAHRSLSRADQFKGTIAIIVNNLKLKLLVQLEVVLHLNNGLEVRVQIIVDAFGLLNETPLVLLELVEQDLWV